MGKRKKFTPDELVQKWAEYKAYCNDYPVLVHDFSAKNSEFVSAELQHSITYTIEGFCAWLGLSRSAFYANYRDCKRYADIVTRMREECEVDARRKFETGQLPTQLAGLWMSKHGYSTKAAADINEQDRVDAVQGFLRAVLPSGQDLEALYAEDTEDGGV